MASERITAFLFSTVCSLLRVMGAAGAFIGRVLFWPVTEFLKIDPRAAVDLMRHHSTLPALWLPRDVSMDAFARRIRQHPFFHGSKFSLGASRLMMA